MKKNRSPRGSRLLALIIVCPVLWLAVLIWPEVAHSQQETRWSTHTHYVIVVRNTSLKIKWFGELISKDDFRTVINSIPMGLEAASRQIPLWRKPEPGDLISVVFAAAGKDPKPPDKRHCESLHYPYSSGSGQSTRFELDTYFDVRARIVVEEQDSPSDIANPSPELHQGLRESLDVRDCDLIANAYSEGLTLAKGLAAVKTGDANGEEKYKQFFLLVFDFASPAYGSTEFNAMFDVSHEDLAPGTPAHLIAPIGSLKFAEGGWSLDLVNYLDYPADEPGTTDGWFRKNKSKFYPRLRFYRAVAYEARSDPFYDLADSQREISQLNQRNDELTALIESSDNDLVSLERQLEASKKKLNESRINTSAAWTAAATFALLMVLVTWLWWATKGRFRRTAEEHQKELQQMREEQSRLAETQERHLLEFRQALEAEREKQKSLLRTAVCIPDAPNPDQASEFA